jgi:CTP:molybdopterin cytidylyltransferase MocA
MEAVVMAAGEGTRLRPLTERWPKPVLPVGGRPVIGTLLRELAAAGVARAIVVTGHLAEQVEALLGDGGPFGVEVTYARQPQADGSADAVRRAVAAGARAPFLVSAADTVYRPGDAALVCRAFGDGPAAGAMTVRRDPPPGPGKPPVRIVDGLVRRVIDDDPAGTLSSAPLWAMGEPLLPFLEGLSGPPYELADAFQRGIDAGLDVLGLEIGPTRDLTRPDDVVAHNFPYLAGS